MKYPQFGIEFPVEKLFSKNSDPLLSKNIKITEGQYYPFNSLSGSYLFDAIGFEFVNPDEN